MENKITNDFIGGAFIDWVRNNYDIAHQHEMFFSLFERACKKNGVDLYVNKEDTIKSILCKNRKTITYVEGVDTMVNYLCEDTCHKLYGFNALTDIGYPYLWDNAMGSIIMYKFEDYDKQSEGEKAWLNDFSDYLCPLIMKRLVAMTKEFMGTEGEKIDTEMIESVWGEFSNTPNYKWIASFQDLIMYSDAEDYIADYLSMNVIHGAIGNVMGDMNLSDGQYQELYEYVSCNTWDFILKLWSEDTNAINETKADCNLAKEKITMCGRDTWEKTTEDLRKERDDDGSPIWWLVGNFTEGELWEENMAGRLFLINDKGEKFVTYF